MCPHEEKVTAWLLGDLPPEEAQAMTRHLATCAECRAVRDNCADVLTPLRSAFIREQAAAAAAAAAALRSTAKPAAVRRGTPREWLRRAALFAASLGTLGVLLAVAQWRTGRGTDADGNITHITLLRSDGKGAPPLDALPAPAAEPPPALAGLPEGRLLETDGKAAEEIGTGGSPAVAKPQRFRSLLKSDDMARANKAVPQMRPAEGLLLAEKTATEEKAAPSRRTAGYRSEQSKPEDSGAPAYPQAKPFILGGATPAPSVDTNSASATNNVAVTNAPASR